MKKLLLFFVFFFLFYFFSWQVLYKLGVNSLPLQSEDSIPSIFTGITLVKEGTLYLDTYYSMMVSKYPHPDNLILTPYYLRKVGEHYLSAFPFMNTLLALPVFLLYVPFIKEVSWSDIYILSHLSGAFTMALCSSGIFYLLSKGLKYSNKNSILLTLIFSLATINFPLISQSLWQHGAVQFFIILSLIFYLKDRFFLTFLFGGFAVLSRPTALIVLLILGIYILINKKLNLKVGVYAFLGFLIPVLFFLTYNYVYYESITNQGYASQMNNSWLGNFPESFFGIWLSPSKGLLFYSPIFIFTLIGLWKGYKNNQLVQISFWVILAHTLVLSKWKHWYGGYGFGYRMISDVIPFFIFPIGYLLQSFYSKVIKGITVTSIISLIIQFSGLVFFDSIWHSAYDTGFKNTSWLWSFQNSEAAFNIRRVGVKLNILDRACEKCLPN